MPPNNSFERTRPRALASLGHCGVPLNSTVRCHNHRTGSTMHEDISNPWHALRNPRIWNDLAIRQRLKDEFPRLSKITDKWGFVRQVYMEHLPIIMEVSKKNVRAKIDPY